jgi:Skp family chaperone for outer membrane proteins
MKLKQILTLSVISLIGLASCDSTPKEDEVVIINNIEQKDTIQHVDTTIVVTTEKETTISKEEWETIRKEYDDKIEKNEAKIKSLKKELKDSGNEKDAAYEARMKELEMKNDALKEKLKMYNTTQQNWNAFKSELNRDMDDLGNSLNNFTIKSK